VTRLLSGALWVLVALAGLVCVDLAASPDAAETAWMWLQLPSWTGLLLADCAVTWAAWATGGWRLNPDTSGESPMYAPTALGRRLDLLSVSLMERIDAHELAPIARLAGFPSAAEFRKQIDRRRAEATGERKWRDLGVK
jgi:hypothetical protein